MFSTAIKPCSQRKILAEICIFFLIYLLFESVINLISVIYQANPGSQADIW